MIISSETIYFRSEAKNWMLEALDFKPNTVRLLDEYELKRLTEVEARLTDITITNTKTRAEFTKKITDISHFEEVYTKDFHKKTIVIFSWNISKYL